MYQFLFYDKLVGGKLASGALLPPPTIKIDEYWMVFFTF